MADKKYGITSDKSRILCDFCVNGKIVLEGIPGFLMYEATKCSEGLETFKVGDSGGLGKQKCSGFKPIDSALLSDLTKEIQSILEEAMGKKLNNKRVHTDKLLAEIYAKLNNISDLKEAKEELTNKVLDELTKPNTTELFKE